MVDTTIEDKVLVREFDDEKDIEMVGKLEKNCEILGSNDKGTSIFTNMVGDPLCRIRFFPLHLMLVSDVNFKTFNPSLAIILFLLYLSLSPFEIIVDDLCSVLPADVLEKNGLQVAVLRENGELVGVIRGCIKHVGTKFGASYFKLGCILGLRVSPRHRRMGIGLKLVRAMEEWLINNEAHYTFLATEKDNVASTNLFTAKCNYRHLSSLLIFVQPISFAMDHQGGISQDIRVEKLNIEQAICFYDNKLKGKDIFLTDIEAILKEKLSLGTWVSYFKQDKEKNNSIEDIISTIPSSWAMFSIWNSCEAHHPLKPFGFLFLYGLLGEGERLGELMKSAWSFASRLAENVKDCEVIITELGVSDPLMEHVPNRSSMSRIEDVWYLKKVNGSMDDEDELGMMGEIGNVVVDPRDF